MEVQNDQNGNGRKRPPGNGGFSSHFFAPVKNSSPDRPETEASRILGVAADLAAPLIGEAYNLGYKRAITRGDPKGHPDDIQYLREHTKASAEALRPAPYDPHSVHDESTEKEILRLEDEREDRKADLKTETRAHELNIQERANSCINPEKPSYPVFSVILAGMVLGVSFAIAIHDPASDQFDDDLMAWLFSTLASTVIGVFLAHFILGEYKNIAQGFRNFRGMIGGIIACSGIAGIRLLSLGFTNKGLGWTVALCLLEIGTVVMVAGIVPGLTRRYLEFVTNHQEKNRYDELVNASGMVVNRLRDEISEIEEKLQNLKDQRAERISLWHAIPALANLLLQSALDGYQAGLAEIAGRFRSRWVYNFNKEKEE
jgi:hypothetical protein